jgi:hypothetical protein
MILVFVIAHKLNMRKRGDSENIRRAEVENSLYHIGYPES